MTPITLRAATVGRFLGSARFLAAAAIVLCALLAAQGVRRLRVGRHERAVLKSLTLKNGAAPERVKTKPVEEFDRTIMETGMLGPAPQPLRLQGIMGSEALFGASTDDAQPMKAGDALPDGRKIVEIRANEVVVEKDGQRQTEAVFQQLQQQPMPGPGPASPPGRGLPRGGVAPHPTPDVPPGHPSKPPAASGPAPAGGANAQPGRSLLIKAYAMLHHKGRKGHEG